jgi:hypothetical protein
MTNAGRLPSDTGLLEGWHATLRQAENQVGRGMHRTLSLGDRFYRRGIFSGLEYAIQVAGSLLSEESERPVWEELQNRMEAFGAFAYPESLLQMPLDTDMDVLELIEKALSLDPYTAVWVTEGIGHLYARRHLQREPPLRNMLRDDQTRLFPDRALIPLHAGMGLSFAEHVLRPLSGQTTRAGWQRALTHFLELCRQNSRDGYARIAIEALGLVARTLHPDRMPLIDRILTDDDLEVLGLFWHGAGRGLYFLPVQFLPYTGSARRMVDLIRQEAPHRLGLYNMMAGFAWPLTLVNIRHPHIVETYLRGGFNRIAEQSAFSQGIRAALLTWYDSSPDEAALRDFFQYRPDPSDPATFSFWTDQIRERGGKAIRHIYPDLKKTHRMEGLFRHQPDAAW